MGSTVAYYLTNDGKYIGFWDTPPDGKTVKIFFVPRPSTLSADADARTITLTYASIADGDTIDIDGVRLTCITGTAAVELAQFKKETDGDATAQNLDDLIGNLFKTVSGVTVSVSSSIVTVTGATSITTSNTTGFVIADSTYSTPEIDSQYHHALVDYATYKALLYLGQDKRGVFFKNEWYEKKDKAIHHRHHKFGEGHIRTIHHDF